MNTKVLAWLAAAACVMGVAGPAGAAERAPVRHQPAAAQRSEAARVIVQFRSDAPVLRAQAQSTGTPVGPRAAEAMGQRLHLALVDGRAIGPRMQVLKASGIGAQALAARLSADSQVEWAVVDQRRFATAAPNDPLYPRQTDGTTPTAGQWYLRPNSGEVKASIDVEPAWAVTTGSSSVVVAVLDTGVRFNHPDLSGKLLAGYDFVGYGGSASVATANDGDLADADASDPGDWITAAENASGEFKDCGESDSSWHGTQVSGLVGAATNNGVGIAGIGRGVQVLPVRVLGKCGGYDSDIIAGMRWAAGFAVSGVTTNPKPARVLNLSLGSAGDCSSAYRSVMSDLTAAGVTVVAAAGNDGLAIGVPANCPNVIAVTGVRHAGTKVGYSNLGPEAVVSAPAGNCVNQTGTCLYPIVTTTNTGTTSPAASTYSDGDVRLTLGTSFSSPIVAGTVALMLSADPALTPADVRSLLMSTARPFPSSGAGSGVGACRPPGSVAQVDECYCTTSTCGAGLLDAGVAVKSAAAAASGLVAAISASPASPVVGDTLTLDASGSSAGSGKTIVSYLWEITSGGSIASFTGATDTASTTLDLSATGSLTVRLTITDSAGNQAVDSRQVTVVASALKAAIVAMPATLEAGDSSTLDASGSTVDAGRSIASYLWQITGGSGIATFSGATNASSATLVTSGAGTVVVQLTITDSAGNQSSATKSFNVTNTVLSAAFTATPTAPEVGDSVALDASASLVGTNRTIASYQWDITAGDGVAAFAGATTHATATLQAQAAGTVTVRLTITDSLGAQSSLSRTLSVSAASSSGGGGGALAPAWALGLLLAAAGLGRRRRG
jgi:serine protease